jgi:surface antigen
MIRRGDRRPGGLLPGLVLVGAILIVASATGAAEEASVPSPYRNLSGYERELARTTVQQTLETRLKNETGRWSSPQTGALGLITPLRTYRVTTGHYCREFVEIVSKWGEMRSALQRACRDDRGRWRRLDARS